MVAAIAIVLGITAILLIGIPWMLKATFDIEKVNEDHLLDPGTPKVVYTVPDGIDAAVVCTALDSAGFATALDFVGGDERVLVEAHPGDRERVRSVIADSNQRAYAASGLKLGAVTFVDEH